jgi:hypothetical protein
MEPRTQGMKLEHATVIKYGVPIWYMLVRVKISILFCKAVINYVYLQCIKKISTEFQMILNIRNCNIKKKSTSCFNT